MPNQNTGSIETKKINRNRIFKLIYNKGELSKQNIVTSLNMSLPTVTHNLQVLEKQNLILASGSFESTGGRKARAMSCNKTARLAVGVDITRNHVVVVVIDMCGNIIKNTRVRLPFANEAGYFKKIGKLIEEIIEDDEIDKAKLLGVGISVPGILSADSKVVTYASVLGFTGGKLESFVREIHYPCRLSNDASAAGIAELWNSENVENVVYLSLSNSVGGAVLWGKRFYSGDNHRSGEFGHITIEHNGKSCYCGQKGCVDTYCNSRILSDVTDGNLLEFFNGLKDNNMHHKKIWNEYMKYLSITVNNLRMIFDCSVIIGGYVGSLMDDYIDDLRDLVSEMNSFEKDGNYVDVCKYKMEASAVGAALLHVEAFINNI